METYEIWSLVIASAMLVSTGFYTFFTARLIQESKKSREAQLLPNIVAYLHQTETSHNTVFLCLENTGNGAALDLKFNILHDIKKTEHVDPLREKEFFISGTPILPQKQKSDFFLAFYSDDIKDEYVEFEIKYTNEFGREMSSRFKLVIKQGLVIDKGEPPFSYMGQIAYYLKLIQKDNRTKNKV